MTIPSQIIEFLHQCGYTPDSTNPTRSHSSFEFVSVVRNGLLFPAVAQFFPQYDDALTAFNSIYQRPFQLFSDKLTLHMVIFGSSSDNVSHHFLFIFPEFNSLFGLHNHAEHQTGTIPKPNYKQSMFSPGPEVCSYPPQPQQPSELPRHSERHTSQHPGYGQSKSDRGVSNHLEDSGNQPIPPQQSQQAPAPTTQHIPVMKPTTASSPLTQGRSSTNIADTHQSASECAHKRSQSPLSDRYAVSKTLPNHLSTAPQCLSNVQTQPQQDIRHTVYVDKPKVKPKSKVRVIQPRVVPLFPNCPVCRAHVIQSIADIETHILNVHHHLYRGANRAQIMTPTAYICCICLRHVDRTNPNHPIHHLNSCLVHSRV
ncbi:hypothetical protein BLNAU_12541 [Blattamonas nauphoetae]|uniref:Uncharacterized protein n=1 Tax=Blattamonas nauphoetae TaxID=2049346 RepID=A0ABQ9XQM5_9EUKA|nr:hypothetical protein BLNAU_12541 [Blattamonas nauphoetae]